MNWMKLENWTKLKKGIWRSPSGKYHAVQERGRWMLYGDADDPTIVDIYPTFEALAESLRGLEPNPDVERLLSSLWED